MKQIRKLVFMGVVPALILFTAHLGFAAYNHAGETDSIIFTTTYPNTVGTKLDSCATCHGGGSVGNTNYGSCQWCHYKTNYGADLSDATLRQTLNPYGLDYLNNGRNANALLAISGLDSDGDGYSNAVEIADIRYPGDPNDNPSKVPAPSRVFTRDEIEQMPQHTQFLLMNASKSTDVYTQYTGVRMGDLLNEVGLLPTAKDISVIAVDGFSQLHPLYPDPSPVLYHVFGDYPQGTFYYNERADIAKHPADPPNWATGGWCDYSDPNVSGRNNGDPIINPDGLKMLLAIKRDGQYLDPAMLDAKGKLISGEGPFRVVPPQKVPGPPDQRSSSTNQSVIWPYDKNADHNAGFSSKCVTIVKVEPLPNGTTDIDLLEAGLSYIDQNKIVVYGAIDPVPTILEKLDALATSLGQISGKVFKNSSSQSVLINNVEVVEKQIMHGAYLGASQKLQNDILQKTDGCVVGGSVDRNDWVTDCDIQKELYWAIKEIIVLLYILL